MKLNQLADNPGARKGRKRVGRGMGSGLGKTSGHGQKGQKSRSGVAIKGFEGGQMPLHRRLPKRGFHNPTGRHYAEVTTGRLQHAVDGGKLDPARTVDAAALKEAGLIKSARDGVRVLVKGDITAKLDIAVAGASKPAIAAIEKAGGRIAIIPSARQARADSAPAASGADSKPAEAAPQGGEEAGEQPEG